MYIFLKVQKKKNNPIPNKNFKLSWRIYSMNTLRNYLLVFTMVLMSVCFVACGNNTTTDNETTTAK